ncbi:hypothetical protein Q4S45_02095 [Massilia sp. R2A-15]|uniref:hypothetical protein n=1 Tax=Massilia sp. R2A-15 TaxID=3064278 RepID=UPI0027360E7B|nr:hypothetical protein [Massilia sp. R2A-15]WLI89937.1 hypothetical protein Q4S45_02095 [Massilia sp. R2A-15]
MAKVVFCMARKASSVWRMDAGEWFKTGSSIWWWRAAGAARGKSAESGKHHNEDPIICKWESLSFASPFAKRHALVAILPDNIHTGYGGHQKSKVHLWLHGIYTAPQHRNKA